MTRRHVGLDAVVRSRIATADPGGERWLATLPALVDRLERDWSIAVEAQLAGGTAAYVARVRAADGVEAVLKLALPGKELASEARLLEAARGRGYVRLLAYDATAGALLLESLGAPLDAVEPSVERQIEVLCATLRQAWAVPPHHAAGAGTKAQELRSFVAQAWEELGHPCSERVVAAALAAATRRDVSFDAERCVAVHGDPHPGNALRVQAPRAGAETGFVFVDPDSFLAEPAYDLGVVLRGWCAELLAGDASALAQRYCALLARESGEPEDAIWEWGLLERVSTGLYLLEHGAEALGRPFLESAERLV